MRYKNDKGFTMVELLVAMGIAAVVMAGVYSVYYSQQKSYVTQERMVAMQQNIRAGMTLLSMDIMSAGYDPTGGSLGVGLTSIPVNSITFTRSIDDSGTTTETIQYGIWDPGDGINYLYRQVNTDPRAKVAENIDEINFIYLDAGRNIISVDNATERAKVRSIQVTMVARTGRGDPGYVNNTPFYNKQGDLFYTAPGDNARRMDLVREIKCRNLI